MTGREDEANEASSSDESTDSLANARDSRATSIQAIPADRRRARQQSAQVKVKAQARLKKGYRDLLNTTIRELNPLASSVSAFATSQLGHVIWSSIEKEALFHQLSLKGAADLPALQKAVGSKSELQIRSYLLLLQEGRKGSSLTTSSRAEKQHVDPPSAFEISEDDTEMNWHHLENISADVDQPAVYKSAIADLQNLTINITRRLVQATLFQAMSRLRAEDSSRKDWTPSAAVRQMDVRAAMQILNLPSTSRRSTKTAGLRRRMVDF
ncbi:uncharacterized protein MYCGRDRAFT_96168 [Zymoseptoria tritici IPO323]|uniref:Myb-like domain-containing protein n=1 Tax=Zymoseptoria tritici (strain CBS 115943 / IPO323) TaxID=336722 RepID=F9XLN8_ZYMTI|nr:uncharacterized protein MYCGRDRAFT_96168 [Zymoseptoria tritici IPO323]EGP84135.1 hypothetical protein MYCGRDRAFT_96168 [Zymoseptoria tritici IPO323]